MKGGKLNHPFRDGLIIRDFMKAFESKKDYQPLMINLHKPFEELSPKEAKDYFDWFISHVDERSDYIREKVSMDLQIPIDTLDFSMQSLIPIWQWFLQIVEIRKTPKSVLKDIRKELTINNEPSEFIDDMLREHSMELSVFSRYIIRDIGMYIGKLFIRNYKVLRWDYHTNTKQDSFANMPQIFGFFDNGYNPPFEMQFEPIHYTEMEASKLFDKTQDNKDLYNMCMRWSKWVPNNQLCI